MTRIAPSFFPAADLANLAAEVARVEPGVDMLHVDVMDGHFVPNLTIGPPVVKSMRKYSGLYFDCHLMMTNPGDYLESFKDAGANGCSVHIEAGDTAALIDEMRRLSIDVGLAVNPATPIESYAEFLDRIDMLVVMTVVPGFGGQSFMEEVMPKLRASKERIDALGLNVSIDVDGGINMNTAPIAAEHGADSFVGGNSIFGAADPLDAANQLREAVDAIVRSRQ